MRDPGSVWAPLPEAGDPDGYEKTQFIVHSTGDNASADRIRRYFAQKGVVVESTFIVGVTSDDPTLQIMDSTDNADANGKANQRAISVEVVGDGTGPFTEWQVSEIVRIGRWAAANHPIKLRIIPSEPESGFGWHVMFGAPGPWTSVRGKVCPGAVRIGQLKDRIFPAIFAAAAPEPKPVQEDDMPLLIRNQKGAIALVTDVAVWVGDDVTNAGLQKKYGPPAQVSDKFYAAVTAAANKDNADLLGIRNAAEAILAKADELPPVDVDALAASLAAKMKG